MREDMRAYTLNVTLTFITYPSRETFVVPVIVLSAVKDAGKLRGVWAKLHQPGCELGWFQPGILPVPGSCIKLMAAGWLLAVLQYCPVQEGFVMGRTFISLSLVGMWTKTGCFSSQTGTWPKRLHRSTATFWETMALTWQSLSLSFLPMWAMR